MTGNTNAVEPSSVPETRKLLLRSYQGFSWREVSVKPPRDCTDGEVPVLDLSGIDGDYEARKEIAKNFLAAAENTGFFYIENHGIPQAVIDRVLAVSDRFFHMPVEDKLKVRQKPDISPYGYQPLFSRHVNPSESKDRKETFNFHYEPRFDPLHVDDLDRVPQSLLDALPKDDHVWADAGVASFQPALLDYYQRVITLARRMMRILAIALAVDEDYFDALTKYPGADMAVHFYPGHGEAPIADPDEVGLGAHTDLQILTFLYQSDEGRGLQMLNTEGEWVYAPPRPGTLLVNIGDFLMRLTNDRLKSTVHRVVHHCRRDRYSVPVFFGFNFDEKCAVVPTCVSDDNPAKYEPVTCGELIIQRLHWGAPDAYPAPLVTAS
ncbi:oxidoreductase-like protein [Xylariomycetidae sp. FL0641]|nr:oxidoreductase-like protein [Xylariomycetidae sp. FL0641]